jgi:hypothetical protein
MSPPESLPSPILRLSDGFFSPALCLLAILAGLPIFPMSADWKDSLTPDVPGPYSRVRPFEAEFRVGWTNIEAARAHVRLTNDGMGRVHFTGTCATNGLARTLWQLDGSLESTSALKGFQTISSTQNEAYANYSILTQIVSRPDGIWCLHENFPPRGNPARWKRIKISPLRDLFSGVLFLRSQNLAPGARVSTIIFPGDCPFLVEIKSIGTGKITVAGAVRDAIKLGIRIQRINLKKGIHLEHYGKFQSGSIWISNDVDRIPLRVEINIFVGYVFAELQSIVFSNP